MIDIKKYGKVKIRWNLGPYEYTKEKENSLVEKISTKYGLAKDRIKVEPVIVSETANGPASFVTDVVDNIQDPKFQLELMRKYLKIKGTKDVDFSIIEQIDAEINSEINYEAYEANRRYRIKWLKWDNFLSYGSNNRFDFSNVGKLLLLNGNPANQSGKTTFAIDLLHFLLFGKCSKASTLDKVFNKHLVEATTVNVEGCIEVNGEDYIIERTLTRPAISRRTQKSVVKNKVDYYRVINGEKTSLSDYREDLNEENPRMTNKAIIEAIGNEADFDMIVSVTESSLDDLVKKTEGERGKMLFRWLGLTPIEEKSKHAREFYNSLKRTFVSNDYNRENLTNQNQAIDIKVNVLKDSIKKYKKENEDLEKDITSMENARNALLESKRNVDHTVMSIDINTHEVKIKDLTNQGIKKKSELEIVNERIKEIGDIKFSTDEYETVNSDRNTHSQNLVIKETEYKQKSKELEMLRKGEVCPTCGRKLENVDNTEKIRECESEISEIINDGKKLKKLVTELDERLKVLKESWKLYDERNSLMARASALQANIEGLRGSVRELLDTKKKYNENREAIEANNKIDIEVRNADIAIKGKRSTRETNIEYISNHEHQLNEYAKMREENVKLMERINQEEVLARHWEIYKELVGKDGISKMVLRDALPTVNGKLAQLLNDVCDFDVEVKITDKNDIVFSLLKDGIRSDLSSGSGFELTASAIALRAVLGEISTIPKCSYIIYDEVFGRVAKENYENMKRLLDKVAENYDAVILISHNDEIKDWCDTYITVVKNDNVSTLVTNNIV